MNTFAAKFYRPKNIKVEQHSHVVIVERDESHAVVRVHDRNNYTMTEAAATSAWLNERAHGYPRAENLDNLYNGRG